jgi:hypothetical protein
MAPAHFSMMKKRGIDKNQLFLKFSLFDGDSE